MKLFLALVLCGVTCCLAKPKCSQEDFLKCTKIGDDGKPFSDPQNDEELDAYCSSIMCINEFYHACANMEDEMIASIFDQNERIYGALCFRKRPLRQKFLDNVACLRNALKKVEADCKIDGTEMDHETFCKKLPEALTCAYDIVGQTCNEDAREVFKEIYPNADYHGCGRKKKCRI